MKQFAPILINLKDQRILVIGGGKVALLKVSGISRFTTDITILAPYILDELKEYHFDFIYKSYQESDLETYSIVYACTNNRVLNEQIRKDCNKRHILCTVCDNPTDSDFVSPAVCKINDITISIGTNGSSPRKAVDIRNQIQQLIDDGILKIE